MNLATSALVVNLQIGVAGGAPKAVIAAGAAVRNHFYVNTLAWKGNGDRLLPCKNFTAFMGGYLALKKEFAALVAELHEQQINDKFYVRLDVDPLAQDFSVDFDQKLCDAVRARISKAMKVREARATEDLWSRLIDPLTHFANIMENGKAFRDATVRNLVEVVELLPRLNVADDVDLIEVLEGARLTVLCYSAKELRIDKEMRAMVATSTRHILVEIERIRA